MVNWTGLYTLTSREVGRFFSVYRQTVIPGLISSVLYILIFGFTMEQRISEIQGVSYTMFILPGLIMMNTLMKYLNKLDGMMKVLDYLTVDMLKL